MRRQKSARAKAKTEEPMTTKTLGVRYAEVLKLREAVERTQSNSKLLSSVESSVPKQDSASSYH